MVLDTDLGSDPLADRPPQQGSWSLLPIYYIQIRIYTPIYKKGPLEYIISLAFFLDKLGGTIFS